MTHNSQLTTHSFGFSLLEVLVGFAILSVGLIAALTLINTSISINREASNRLIASMLLDQGFTYIQNIRDTNLLNGRAWDTQIDACDETGDTCIVGYDQSCFSCGNPSFKCDGVPFEILPVNGAGTIFFNKNDIETLNYFQAKSVPGCFASDTTIFTRTVNFERVDGNHVKPSIVVTWSDPDTKSISFTTDLYNVQ